MRDNFRRTHVSEIVVRKRSDAVVNDLKTEFSKRAKAKTDVLTRSFKCLSSFAVAFRFQTENIYYACIRDCLDFLINRRAYKRGGNGRKPNILLLRNQSKSRDGKMNRVRRVSGSRSLVGYADKDVQNIMYCRREKTKNKNALYTTVCVFSDLRKPLPTPYN